MPTPAATTISSHLLTTPRDFSRRENTTPRKSRKSVEYDTRLDSHQQTYALSPRVMGVLKVLCYLKYANDNF